MLSQCDAADGTPDLPIRSPSPSTKLLRWVHFRNISQGNKISTTSGCSLCRKGGFPLCDMICFHLQHVSRDISFTIYTIYSLVNIIIKSCLYKSCLSFLLGVKCQRFHVGF
uniref:Uncharacterized protein n=1 Tax=Cacopsylla melanoneura TaxID=428564 RepID=A0A8D8YTH0_9HEMI